jgi:hypothetical protein
VADDSIAIPGGMAYALAEASSDLELLEITLPGEVENRSAAECDFPFVGQFHL